MNRASSFGIHKRGLSLHVEQLVVAHIYKQKLPLKRKNCEFTIDSVVCLMLDDDLELDIQQITPIVKKVMKKLYTKGVLHRKLNKKSKDIPIQYWLSGKGRRELGVNASVPSEPPTKAKKAPKFRKKVKKSAAELEDDGNPDWDNDFTQVDASEPDGNDDSTTNVPPVDARTPSCLQNVSDAVSALATETAGYRTYLLQRRSQLRDEIEEITKLLGD